MIFFGGGGREVNQWCEPLGNHKEGLRLVDLACLYPKCLLKPESFQLTNQKQDIVSHIGWLLLSF